MINYKGEEVGIIYGWYCTVTDKWYIGQSIESEKRFNAHIYKAIIQKCNTHFHRALRKYGLENWVYCVLEENIPRENLDMKEAYWIEYYDSYYNGHNMTTGGNTNSIVSIETRKKLSESHKGRLHTEETKKKISESNKGKHNYWTGKPGAHRRKVKKYDLNGNYIQTYISIKEAIRQNPQCRSIYTVCRGKMKQSGGFVWKYAS